MSIWFRHASLGMVVGLGLVLQFLKLSCSCTARHYRCFLGLVVLQKAKDDHCFHFSLCLGLDSTICYDPAGKARYLAICQAYGVVPISYFLRHMKDSELTLNHRGLNPKVIAVRCPRLLARPLQDLLCTLQLWISSLLLNILSSPSPFFHLRCTWEYYISLQSYLWEYSRSIMVPTLHRCRNM